MNKLLSKSKRTGLTLIELLIAMAVMIICVAPLLALFNQALRTTVTAQVMTTMSYVGQMAMESMLSADFFQITVSTYANNVLADSDVNSFLHHFTYSCVVDDINPDAATDLSSTSVLIDHSVYTKDRVSGSYYRIHVTVHNDIFPNKSLELWTILTPAGQGY